MPLGEFNVTRDMSLVIATKLGVQVNASDGVRNSS